MQAGPEKLEIKTLNCYFNVMVFCNRRRWGDGKLPWAAYCRQVVV